MKLRVTFEATYDLRRPPSDDELEEYLELFEELFTSALERSEHWRLPSYRIKLESGV